MSEIDEKISTSGVIFGALIVQAGAKGDTGPQGEQGIQGIPGETGKDGKDYILTESDKQEIANNVKSSIQSTLDALSNKNASQDIEITDIKTKNNTQDARLDTLEADNTTNKEIISNLQNDNTTNKTNIKSLQDDNEVNKTDISNIKQEQTTQNTNIQELQTDNTSNKAKILDLEAKNTELDTNIQMNTEDIAEINEKNTAQDEEIAQLKEKDTAQDSLIEELQAENTKLKKEINSMQIPGEATGNPIHLTDSSNLPCEIALLGNSEQETRSGKNKLQLYFSDKTTSGVTITKNEDDSITLIGTATANINFLNLGKFLYEVAKGTFKGCLTYKSGSMKDGSAGLYFSSSTTSGTNKGGTTLEAKNKSFALSSTVTEDANIYPYIYINSGTTFDNFTFYFQVVNSDTDDFDYEQYGAMPSPEYPSEIVTVGQNVNIFNILDYTATLKYTGEAQIFDSNNFRVVAKYSTDSNCMTMFRTIDLTNYAGKTLTIQAIVKSNTDTNKAFIVLRQNNYDYSGTKSNELYDESQNTTDGVITLKYKVVDTINDNNRYLFMGFYATRGNNCNTGDYVDYKVKMVEGTEVGGDSPYGQGSVEISVDNGLETTDTNYQSYTKVLPIQKEFVKIGDVEDTFVKVDGKWYEKHIVGKGKFNPNNIGVNDNGNLRIRASLWGYDNQKDCKVLCKYFKSKYARWDDDNEINNAIYGWPSNGSIGINFDKNKFSTIGDFKNWASEVGLEFYFVKKEPELIPCTAGQEEILNSFYTYKNVTNISVDGIGTLKVNYKKDLETIINNLSATSVAE